MARKVRRGDQRDALRDAVSTVEARVPADFRVAIATGVLAIVAVIVIAFYPETAHTELEVLNPGDAPLPVDAAELAALDATWSAEHDHAHPGHTGPGPGREVGDDRSDGTDPQRDDLGPRDAATRGPTGTIPPRV